MPTGSHPPCRNLVAVLGDQLSPDSAALSHFDDTRDVILQMEVHEEATYIPQHKLRLVYFFAAMRHFHESQRAAGRRCIYVKLDDPENTGTLREEIRRW